MLSEFDTLVQQRRSLLAWWKLKNTEAVYDRQKYTLRVDVSKPSLVTFCGQQYAGDRNYHDAPEFFVNAVHKELQRIAKKAVVDAYESELARLNAEIDKHRAEVLVQLNAYSKEVEDGDGDSEKV